MNSTNNTDACSRGDAHMRVIERERLDWKIGNLLVTRNSTRIRIPEGFVSAEDSSWEWLSCFGSS